MENVNNDISVSKTAEINLSNDSSENNTGDIMERISSSNEYSSVILIKSNKNPGGHKRWELRELKEIV